MDDGFCELLRCCCECGLCIGLCCLCCKDNDSNQRRDPYYANGQTVTVTSQPAPNQPYPVHGGPPPAGYGGASPYQPVQHPGFCPPPMGFCPPPMGYPPNSGAPYPPVGGYPPGPVPGGAPYPPTSYPPPVGFQNQPPPYDVAVSMPPPHPPQTEAYSKQSPYNPHYQN